MKGEVGGYIRACQWRAPGNLGGYKTKSHTEMGLVFRNFRQGELGNKEVIYRREGSKASWWAVGSGTGGQHAFGSICAGLRSWSAKLRNGWRRVCAAARRSGERRAQQRRSPVSFEMSLALSARLMLAAQKLRPHPRDFQPAAGFRVPFENGWVEFSVSGLISIHETSAKYFCQVEKRKRSILDRDDEGHRNERPPRFEGSPHMRPVAAHQRKWK
ncbi:hypothetical protein C8J57DRAFT_1229708 [Mycena rebaudengoi]|nr:hypothetical protein C8J57DRAFT_1229708 [Mycena rebaudengoi]